MLIGELAAKTGMTAKALRFYEQAGVLPEPARTPAGYRDYDPAALDRLAFVRAAQAAGLTLAEVRRSSPCGTPTGRRAPTSPACSTGTPRISTTGSPR